MQPIDHRLLLLYARPSLTVLLPMGVLPQGPGSPRLGRLGIVGVDEAGADEEEVSHLDITSLCHGANINSLVLPRLGELLVGDGVILIWVWLQRCQQKIKNCFCFKNAKGLLKLVDKWAVTSLP